MTKDMTVGDIGRKARKLAAGRMESSKVDGELELDPDTKGVPSFYCDGVATLLKGDGVLKIGFHEVLPSGKEIIRRHNVFVNIPLHRVVEMVTALESAMEVSEDESNDA